MGGDWSREEALRNLIGSLVVFKGDDWSVVLEGSAGSLNVCFNQ